MCALQDTRAAADPHMAAGSDALELAGLVFNCCLWRISLMEYILNYVLAEVRNSCHVHVKLCVCMYTTHVCAILMYMLHSCTFEFTCARVLDINPRWKVLHRWNGLEEGVTIKVGGVEV